MDQKVLVTKIVKGGFGRKINSDLGYASFEIASGAIEIAVEPAIDLATAEGKETYKKLQDNLSKLAMEQLNSDTDFYRKCNEELNISLQRLDKKVQSITTMNAQKAEGVDDAGYTA